MSRRKGGSEPEPPRTDLEGGGTLWVPPPPGAEPQVEGTVDVPAPVDDAAATERAAGTGAPPPPTAEAATMKDSGERTPVTAATLETLASGPLPAGGLRFGAYRLMSELGRGGMGVVYKALHLALNREVALKLMISQDVPEAERARFLREAESSAALKHPYIVPVHDVGVEEGKLFFSMDFIEGKTFKSLIQEYRPDLRFLLTLFAKICDAVGYAHRKGIIHRDLKPQNVMVDPEMNPHVMDFGLARKVGEREAARKSAAPAVPQSPHLAQLTHVGAVMGTPAYMPPEQAAGRTDEVDTRSDVYSLGVILYSILAGEVPFHAKSTQELLGKIETEPPPPPRTKNPRCPWELERVTLKAIEKKREDRYQTAFDLKEDVDAWLAGRPVAAARGGPLYRARKFVLRNRVAVALGALAALTLAGGGVYVARQAEAERRGRQARAASQVADGRADLSSAKAKWAEYEAGRAKGLEANADQALAEAAKRYGLANDGFSAARALDRTAGDPGDDATAAALGLDRALKAQARDQAERESREKARELVAAATAKLAAVEPGAVKDLAGVEAAKAEVDAARAGLLKALGLDAASQGAQDGLTLVVGKLQALGERETTFARRARLEELGREADAALRAAEAEKDPGAARLDLRHAIGALSEALRVDPADPDIRAKRVQAALALGGLALKARDLALAEYAVDEVRDLGAERVAKFLDEVRRAREDEGRYTRAIQAAEVAREAERFRDAATAYQEALLATPGRREAEFGLRFARGGAAAQEGRHEEALSLLAEAAPFAERPADRGALERAQARSRAALADALAGAAEAAIRASRFDEATRALERALELRPDHPLAQRLLVEVKARRAAPEGTVAVPGGAFTFGRGAGAREGVECAAFFIGRTEASNREYRQFVVAGGYERAELWDPEGFAARAELVGRDGKPGPLGWAGGKPPEGTDDLPVTGVSWYEARAFARFKGRGFRLPTDVEWEKAASWDGTAGRKADPPWLARGPDGSVVSSWLTVWRPYFNRPGPKPVGSPFSKSESGVALFDPSPSEALDLWGNVRELVVVRDGERDLPGIRGGSFSSRVEERANAFHTYRPDPLYRTGAVGFRLAKSVGE